jgi:two-component system chemotaxis sensor kinase CheA
MPLTLATFRGIHVSSGGHEFIIPTHNVVRVFRTSPEKIYTVENHQTLTVDDLNFAYLELHQILGLSKQAEDQEHPLKPVLLIKASDAEIAVGVDSIFSEQEVFVKGLGKQLQRVRNIAATTIMEWGKVIPILDPFDLVKSAVSSPLLPFEMAEQGPKVETDQKEILIVEDSITSRMLLKNILEASGYKVKSAVDGAEGFDKLLKEGADLVLSDVEMPRMNGFELTAKIRSSEKFKDIPIILCTSRGSQEDREHGIAVGANAYLDKSNFKQQNLLEIIDQLLG